jgi:hypothetical protein
LNRWNRWPALPTSSDVSEELANGFRFRCLPSSVFRLPFLKGFVMRQIVVNPPKFQRLPIIRADRLERIARSGLDSSDWYARAQRDIETVCALERWNVQRVTDVIAITSPRVSVVRNIRIALQYCHNGQLFTNVVRNIGKALARYETGGALSGQKISAFSKALSGDVSAIVLDVHIARALNVRQDDFTKPRFRAHCFRAVQRLANRLELSPRDAQAALWVGWKRWNNETAGEFPILREYANFLKHRKRFPLSGTVETLASSSDVKTLASSSEASVQPLEPLASSSEASVQPLEPLASSSDVPALPRPRFQR